MTIPDNYIECEVVVTYTKNAGMGIAGDMEYRHASIDMDNVFHFWDHGNEHTVLCNEYGQSIYIAAIPYNEFKHKFYKYHNSLMLFKKDMN